MKELIMVMDDDICDALSRIADRRNLSIQELIRRFINLGVTVDEIEQSKYEQLLVHDYSPNGGARELVIE